MNWERVDKYVERTPEGYRVAATKDARGWMFLASGPDVAPGVPYYKWPPDNQMRVTYPRGTSVPQRFPDLGWHETAAQARAACEAHASAACDACAVAA